MSPRIAHLIVHGDQVTLQAPYDQEFLEDFKQTIPYAYRQWDPDSKVWLVECCKTELISICREYYARVIVHDEDTKALQTSDWAAAMFDAVPAQLHRPVYRALSRVLHPDAGGDLASMQALAAAHTERKTAA